MKWFIFRSGLILILLLLSLNAFAVSPPGDTVEGDTLTGEENTTTRKSRYERQSERYIRTWNSLIPDYSKIQIAGGMGVVSVGVGWDYGRKKQWETDFFIGILPRFSAQAASMTFTLKQNYIPWRYSFGGKWALEPLTTGMYINKLTSRNFWGREPEKYGSSYYRFSTNTRFSIFVGQRLTLGLSDRFPHRSISFFYEFSTCDLYLISAFSNKSLGIDDILVLSLGLKFQFL